MVEGLPVEFWILLSMALVVASLGFLRFIWFISIGYGYAITSMAMVALVLFRDHLTPLVGLQLALLGLYGLRLGTYLMLREFRQSYKQELQKVDTSAARISFLRKLVVWIGVAVLYALMFSPALFNLVQQRAAGEISRPVLALGVSVMVLGLGMESTADRQKSAFKAQFPRQYCDRGLFRIVRYPNYLGEILFWTGNWIAALASYTGPVQWICGVVGLAGIILIMMNSTMMLERKQDDRYGDQAAYITYTHTIPILFPGVPLYTLRHIGDRVHIRL